MPAIETTSVNSSPYQVYQEERLVDEHHDWHKASETAFNAALECACDTEITQTLRVKVRYIGAPKGVKRKYIVLSWDRPTKRSNGAELKESEIHGYEIKHVSLNGSEVVDSKAYIIGPKLSHIFKAFDGLNGMAVATVDTNGLQSSFSDLVTLPID